MENMVKLPHLFDVYKGKKVFVTGHTGFKGSWLVATLHKMGAAVMGYSLAPEYPGSLYEDLLKRDMVESVIADIRDRNELKYALADFEPDFVFHLAAQPLVRRSYSIPAETFDINVVGTANLLEFTSELKKPCATVIVTTDKVYENIESEILYKESDTLGGYDPYSSSKACAELVVTSFRRSFFDPGNTQKGLASARAGNVIGGGDWSKDRLVPDIVRDLLAGRSIQVRNPNSVRPWQHVLEPVGAYLKLGAALHENPSSFSEAFNIGPREQDHLSVRQLVELSIEYWGGGSWMDCSQPGNLHEAGLLKLDISKIKDRLNWEPLLDAASAIRWTIEWYKEPADKRTDLMLQQISNYFSNAI